MRVAEANKRNTNRNKEKIRVYAREARRAVKFSVLGAYGLECSCCGEDGFPFLQIDHIEGNGAQHRRELKLQGGGGQALYKWLIQNNVPEGFQTLCANCNVGKGTGECCPHQLPSTDPRHVPLKERK